MGRAPIIPRAAHHVGAHWRALSEIRGTGERFVPALTEPLPPAARRWINHAVAEGTPMAAAARLEMSGQIRLGSWRPFTAVQLLAPTSGFVWAATTRIGPVSVSGYDRFTDGCGEMRWRIGGIIPVMSADGPDVSDSAAGRLAGESIFVPTSFPLARWRGDEFVAAATWTVAGRKETVRLDVAEDGALCGVRMLRWGNPDNHEFGRYPFIVAVEAEHRFGGMTIASRIRASWDTGTGTDGEFFRAEITSADFF
ncbi:hypothetical protein M1C57_01335 [Rhodococcus pyridinivorans]|uniref:Uncharacterized protein n=4 Tax=Rhodococcus TaxID=1827 RepID=H0JR44_9NOCA|nr:MULTISPECIES: DUF6544 family protein [Rhodococcus]EHK83827.1 hypothetical protein AK37_10651 [Rhodococcus pyridinivorans AK37]MCD2140303.1 hypothetical protein [Rhodococcus pyridinivorans]MCD5421832.1 hypothetical protein [Rhodococcus pyridinivorans]TWH51537.1 hypothetical protein L612_002600000470 [Rhodococcus rhodochrous J38]UPW04754.1 hypothetical protein M1C57_01335 [Rhodococcus pyridinivorans]